MKKKPTKQKKEMNFCFNLSFILFIGLELLTIDFETFNLYNQNEE